MRTREDPVGAFGGWEPAEASEVSCRRHGEFLPEFCAEFAPSSLLLAGRA